MDIVEGRLPIIDEISKSLSTQMKSLVIFSVASHHTALHQDLYVDVEDLSLEVVDKSHFEDIIDQLANKIGIDSFEIANCYDQKCKEVLNKAKYNFFPSSFEEGIRLREYFIDIQGILNYSDWLASGQNQISGLHLKNFLSNPYHYQVTAQNTMGNVFITLPTGSGKTETALSWISGNLVDGFRQQPLSFDVPT